MAEIVNLRRARKKKERAEREATAAANRLHFGRSKAERQKAEAEEALTIRRIDGHKLDRKTDQ